MESNPKKIIMVFEMKYGSEIWSSKEKYQGTRYVIGKNIIYKEDEYTDLKDGRGLFIMYLSNGKKIKEYYFKWPAKDYFFNVEKGEYKYWNENGKLTYFRYFIDKNDSKYKDAEKHEFNDILNYFDLMKHPEYIKQYNLDIRF